MYSSALSPRRTNPATVAGYIATGALLGGALGFVAPIGYVLATSKEGQDNSMVGVVAIAGGIAGALVGTLAGLGVGVSRGVPAG